MEKIIIYAFIIAIVALFEYTKKRAQGAQSRKKVDTPKRNVPPVAADWEAMFGPAQPIPAPARPAAPQHQKATTAPEKPARPSTPPKPTQQFLPGEQTDEISLPMEATPAPGTLTGSVSTQQNAEHYARWRQAIIDAEVLQRKF